MYTIGLSGQTGAGKSLAAELLSKHGYGENIEVDSIGHILLTKKETKQQLKNSFGNTIFDDNGEVIRKELGRIAFSSIENTEKLNSIMHPAMVEMITKYIQEKDAQGEKYIIINAALLFKMGLDKLCNKILYISASPETRLKRLTENRGMTKEAAISRLNSQDKIPDQTNNKIVIIKNEGNIKDLENVIISSLQNKHK